MKGLVFAAAFASESDVPIAGPPTTGRPEPLRHVTPSNISGFSFVTASLPSPLK